MNQKGKDHAWHDQKYISKRIPFFIIRLSNDNIRSHQINNPKCCHQVDYFHDRVVERNVRKEEVQVSTDKDQQVQLLCFQRNTCTNRDRVIVNQ
jgi:hypothetical protein